MLQISSMTPAHVIQSTTQSDVEPNSRSPSQAQDTLEEKGCIESIGEWFNWLWSLLCCCWQSPQIEESSSTPIPQPTGSIESCDQDNAIEGYETAIPTREDDLRRTQEIGETTLYTREGLKSFLIEHLSFKIREEERELLSQSVDTIIEMIGEKSSFDSIKAEFDRHSWGGNCFYYRLTISIPNLTEAQCHRLQEKISQVSDIEKLLNISYESKSMIFHLTEDRMRRSND